MKARIILILLSLILFAPIINAQEADSGYFFFQRKAIEAYQKQDFQTFVEFTRKGLELNPNSTSMMYNLACGYSLTGQDDKAIGVLQKLAAMGVDYGAAHDPDFKHLKNRKDFKELMTQYREMETPILTSKLVSSIPQLDLLPEGISYDPARKRIFVGSMRFGSIYAIDSNGSYYEFCRLENDIPLAAVGIEVDTIRNLLWAVGSSFNYRLGFKPEDERASAVFGFDLNTGKLAVKKTFPGKPPQFGFNDLTVSKAGNIYVTSGCLYLFPAGSDSPTMLLSQDHLINSNGITLSPDEKILFISDYVSGIVASDLETGIHKRLAHPDSVTLYGVDGMYFYDGSLVAIQNSFSPWRAVRFILNADMDSITGMQILERGNPDLEEAFTGTIVGDEFYYVGHGNNPAEYPDFIPNVIRRDIGETVVMKTSLKNSR